MSNDVFSQIDWSSNCIEPKKNFKDFKLMDMANLYLLIHFFLNKLKEKYFTKFTALLSLIVVHSDSSLNNGLIIIHISM